MYGALACDSDSACAPSLPPSLLACLISKAADEQPRIQVVRVIRTQPRAVVCFPSILSEGHFSTVSGCYWPGTRSVCYENARVGSPRPFLSCVLTPGAWSFTRHSRSKCLCKSWSFAGGPGSVNSLGQPEGEHGERTQGKVSMGKL